MLSKKMKKYICLLGIVTGVFVGSMNAFAASYVGGSLKGFNCNGSIKYDASNKAIIAQTHSEINANLCTKTTTVTGTFLRYDQALSEKSAQGTNVAQIIEPTATGYRRAYGTHRVYYSNDSWGGGTDL